MSFEYIVSDLMVIFASILSSFGVYFSYHILLNRSRTTTIKMIKEVSDKVKKFYDEYLQIGILYQLTMLSFALIPAVIYVLSYIEINNGGNYISANHPFSCLLLLAIFYAAEIIILFALINPHNAAKLKNGNLSRMEMIRFMLRKYVIGLVSFIVISSSYVFYEYFTLEEASVHKSALYLIPYFHVYLITRNVSSYTSLQGYVLIYSSLLSGFILLMLIISIEISKCGKLKWYFLDYENQLFEKFKASEKSKLETVTVWLAGNEKDDKVTGKITKMVHYLELKDDCNCIYTLKWDQIVAVSTPGEDRHLSET